MSRKTYLHPKQLGLSITVFLIGFLVILAQIVKLNRLKTGIGWGETFYIFSGLSTIIISTLILIRVWKFRYHPNFPETRMDLVTVNIEPNHISYPERYFFRQSEVHKLKSVTAGQITEINPETFPPSLVRQNREVLFVKYDQKEKLIEFAKRNHIPQKDRFDIWEHINLPYLDTEQGYSYKKESLLGLYNAGLTKEEIRNIRKKNKEYNVCKCFCLGMGLSGVI